MRILIVKYVDYYEIDMEVKSISIYVDVDVIYVDEYEIDMWERSIAIYVDMCWWCDIDLWVKLNHICLWILIMQYVD